MVDHQKPVYLLCSRSRSWWTLKMSFVCPDSIFFQSLNLLLPNLLWWYISVGWSIMQNSWVAVWVLFISPCITSDTVRGGVRRLQYLACHCCRQTSIGEHEVCLHGKRQQFSISQQWAQGHRLSPAYSQMVLLLLILYVPVCTYVMGS